MTEPGTVIRGEQEKSEPRRLRSDPVGASTSGRDPQLQLGSIRANG
jgi:hypothetical protein